MELILLPSIWSVLDLNVPQALWDALINTLNSWAIGLSNMATEGVQRDLAALIAFLKTVNFVTTIPSDIVNLLANKIGLGDILPLLNALTGTALLFAAVSYAGHYVFGWPTAGYWVQRIGVAIILVKMSQQLTDWTLMLGNSMTQDLAAALPDMPDVPPGGNPVLLAILEVFWVFLLFRLVLDAGKIVVWLMLLKPVAGLAFLGWMIPAGAWVSARWTNLWVGLLIGHFMLVLGLSGGILLITLGGFGGFVLSAAALIVAREAIYMFVPASGGDPLFKVGPVKIG